jgi:hypothetical protein
MLDILSKIGLVIATLIIAIFVFINNLLFKCDNDKSSYNGGSRDRLMNKKKREKITLSESECMKFFDDKRYVDALTNIIKKPIDTVPTTMSDLSERLQYKTFNRYAKTSTHNGQIKLLLTELQFLTDDLFEKGLKYDDEILFVYAGSAPCNHMFMIEKLFPNIRFLLIDPNEHCIFYEDPKNPEYYLVDKDEDIKTISKNRSPITHYNEEYVDKYLYYKLAKGNRFEIQNRKINCYHINKVIQIDKNNQGKIEELNSDFTEADIILSLFQTKHKYYIYEDLMTDLLADTINTTIEKLGKKVYFCSDIRTNTSTDEDDSPTDLDILHNSVIQYNWVKKMQNNLAKVMLKFRTPYMGEKDKQYVNRGINTTMKSLFQDAENNGLDMKTDYVNGIFSYFKADRINIQAFPGQSSTETRIIIDPKTIIDNDLVKYDSTDYEEKLFYYNRVIRPYNFFNDNKPYISKEFGIDHCSDCVLFANIIKNYYVKLRTDLNFDEPKRGDIKSLHETVKHDMIYIMKVLGRSLSHNTFHGKFFKPFNNIDDIKSQQKELCK